ncbi:hypothetical protein LB543_24905 [Mesorhizobium sp. ESP7-2]|uniref:hypothetical protein n=1 Tax=Mesorhizobium sp. ESP7-2 TaxID=2876622 RepID=UPI001CCC7AA9|nr:hypothetical protein [Mesorhizobium sp. ESP7-2]MBZ9709949.1 hypothetical protein [Mesorhizobium sp. ESP7-2]
MTMPTISRLFDSHAEAARIAGNLLAAGVPRVQIAIIGPYHDEIGVLKSPAVMLGAAAGLLACLGAFAVYDINSFPTSLSAIALTGMFCGCVLGGLLGALVADTGRPERRSVGEGIVLVTAHVDENATDIAQMVLGGGCVPVNGLAAEAA